jgi:hypothetical protein
MKNNMVLECSFGAEASWQTLWGLPCGLLFDVEIHQQISVHKMKLPYLSDLFRQFSFSITLHFRAGIFRYTQFSVHYVNINFSIVTDGSSGYISSDQLKVYKYSSTLSKGCLS